MAAAVGGTVSRRRRWVRSTPTRGVHDMHGNVNEWLEDNWYWTYAGAPSDGTARIRWYYRGIRVMRGGSWSYNPGSLRSALRSGIYTGFRSSRIGFRVARTLTP